MNLFTEGTTMLSSLDIPTMSGNTYLLTVSESETMPGTEPYLASHPRLSAAQVEAIVLLTRGDFVLTNDGRYALEEDGVAQPDLTIRKPVLKTLSEKGMVEFKEKGRKLLWRITQKGREAAEPDSPWRRPVAPPGRQPRPKPAPSDNPARGKASEGAGFTVFFVDHPLAKNQAFPTVREATLFARRIQAGYALKGERPPSITIEHRRYVAFSQKLLVRFLNGAVSDEDVVERWLDILEPHANNRTYSKYEAITK